MTSLKHELRQMFDSGRSINLFDDTEHLEEGLLERIVNLSLLNPSVFPSQPWSALAVKSSLSKHKLAGLCGNDSIVVRSAVSLLILRSSCSPAEEFSHPLHARALLATALMYACKYYAVDSHVVTTFDAEGIRKYFRIEPGLCIETLVCLGYFGGVRPLFSDPVAKRYSQIIKEI